MSDPYKTLIKQMRREGCKDNESGVELGSVKSTSPLTIYVSGTEISLDIYAPIGLTLSAGDMIAVKRARDSNVILAKVEKRI